MIFRKGDVMITNRAFNAKKKKKIVNNINFLKLNSGSIGPSSLFFSMFQRHRGVSLSVAGGERATEVSGGRGRSGKGERERSVLLVATAFPNLAGLTAQQYLLTHAGRGGTLLPT